MHLRELNSAITADSSERNRRKIKLTCALLSASRRFVPVGRTGYWALREWQDVETRTIPDITADILEASPRPLRGIELYRLIKVRRRIGYNSIGTLLGCDKRFKKVARGTWALKKKRA
jgi:hypothetical protein